MNIFEFLTAQLDEDEAAAQAATPGPWHYNPGAMWLEGEAFERFDQSKGEEFVGYGGPRPFTGCVAATGPASHPQSMADAAFIARRDPARALLEVASKRRILERHRRPRSPAELPGGVSSECCIGCGFLGDDGIPARTPHIDLCPELRDLAAPYAERPGFKPAWRMQ